MHILNQLLKYNKKIQINGDWGLGPIPNPQSPIPNPQSPYYFIKYICIYFILKMKLIKIINDNYNIFINYKRKCQQMKK